MSLSMYQASVVPFLHTIGAMSAVIDKAAAFAAAKKVDPSVMLQLRLAPDMLPLVKQFQLVSDFAKNTTGRLAGGDLPKYEDNEKSFDELKARLAKTADYLKSFKPAQVDGTEAKEITIPIGGNPTKFAGQDYLIKFALPNFYFHATSAYAILRHNGVELGKRDFLGRS